MRSKYMLLPASTKITPLQRVRHGTRFAIACYWFFLFASILATLWSGCDVHAQEQSGAGLSQTSATSAPPPVPNDAPTDAALAQARSAVQAGSFSSAEAI